MGRDGKDESEVDLDSAVECSLLFIVWFSGALQEHDSWENMDMNALFIEMQDGSRKKK